VFYCLASLDQGSINHQELILKIKGVMGSYSTVLINPRLTPLASAIDHTSLLSPGDVQVRHVVIVFPVNPAKLVGALN